MKILARAGLTIVAMLTSTGLEAQIVRGQVVDSNGIAVSTGFVVLVDADDRETLRALTTRNGRFSIVIPPRTRGPFRIRSERIGYRVAYSTPMAIDPGRTFDVRLTVARLPVRLAAIEVQDESQCRVRPAEGAATAMVWDEARKALEAASWTASQESYSFEHVRFERTMGAQRRRVEAQSLSVRRGVYRTPFTSRHPDLLAEEGYIRNDNGDRWYYAPDAEVLQSPSFLDTHCFHVVRNGRHPRQVGLGFVPVPGRRLSDIRGTLWLDEETSELRTLEFTFTNVPDRPMDDRIGGRIDFRPIPSGAWIVHQWEIRMPRVGTNTINVGYERRQDTVVTGFYDVGGEVVRIATQDDEVLFQAPNALVSGRVTVENTGDQPVSGAEVRIVDTDYAGITDHDGRYEILVPVSGAFALQPSYPALDSLGHIPPPQRVDLQRGEETTQDFRLPSAAAVLGRLCEGHMQQNHRAIVGVARDARTGRPYAGTRVVARWQSIDPEVSRVWDVEAEASADSLGTFVLCGLEIGRLATLQATYANRVSQPVRILFEQNEAFVGDSAYYTAAPMIKLDVHLQPAAEVATLITGIVTDAGTGRPLAGTLVLVIGAGIAEQTDETGAFRIEGAPPGAVTIVIRHRDYQPKRHDFVLRPGGVLELPMEAISLTPGGSTNDQREP